MMQRSSEDDTTLVEVYSEKLKRHLSPGLFMKLDPVNVSKLAPKGGPALGFDSNTVIA